MYMGAVRHYDVTIVQDEYNICRRIRGKIIEKKINVITKCRNGGGSFVVVRLTSPRENLAFHNPTPEFIVSYLRLLAGGVAVGR